MENNHLFHASINTRLRYAEAIDRHYLIRICNSGVIFTSDYSPTARTNRRFSVRFYQGYCLRHSFYANIIVYILEKVNRYIKILLLTICLPRCYT